MPPSPISPRDLAFLLYEVFDTESLTARPRFADYNREAFDAAIDTARAIAASHFAPHNRKNDLEEPRVENGVVVTIPEVKAAVRALADAGFIAATHDAEVGGMQLPHTVATAALVHFDAANVGTASYALLTTGAANLIATFGNVDQQHRFLRPMLEGRFLGTMALSEPEAGSSLADIRTRAAPAADGTYHLSGTKMWISGGDHELSENIVHLVLAKINGAPDGVRGISLFIVPKFLVGDDGTVGARNGVTLAGLIHKMGWRGTTSTVLNFGEQAPCVGYLVGEPHKGLACMFQMMNEARVSVGRAAAAMGCAAYRYSLDYARTRRQGRLPGEKDPTRPPVPIIEHPDVRRMLLHQKAVAEGALALTIGCARLMDEQETAPDPAVRARAALLLDVLTPIAKAWPGAACQESIGNAMQVLGGYGYAREYPIEQYYRDNRLNPIHEGTNGVQALDLLGRKVRQDGGAAFDALVLQMQRAIAEAGTTAGVSRMAAGLRAAVDRMVDTTRVLVRAADDMEPARALANASAYLDLVSATVIAWLWLRQATVASRALMSATGEARALAPARAAPDDAFYLGKLQAARYWFAWELPKTVAQGELLRRLDATTFEMEQDWF